MKKIKYALLALLSIFTVVVTGCKNPEDQSGSTGSNLTKITSVSDFEKDPLYLSGNANTSSSYGTSDFTRKVSYYIYYYLENGKLYSQNYGWVEITYADTSKEKETYWVKDGESTELSFTDGKIAGATMCKLGDTYFMYTESSENGYSRVSGSGLYSTFEYTEDDISSKLTFKDDGTATLENTYSDSDGNTQTASMPLTYKNNNGLIFLYLNVNGTEVPGNMYYDGSAIYQAFIFEEVSALPTLKESTE